jgi:hypothetical protein
LRSYGRSKPLGREVPPTLLALANECPPMRLAESAV